MSLNFKDNRNNNLKTTPHNPHHLPTSKQLKNKHKKLVQKASAAEKELENIKYLEQEGDMQHFELVNRRINCEKNLKEAKTKIVKLDKEIKYTDLVSNNNNRFREKGQQKSRDIAFRISVHMY